MIKRGQIMEFNEILEYSPFTLTKEEKHKVLTRRLLELTESHSRKCADYKNILKCLPNVKSEDDTHLDVPFMPVRLFKERSLKSIPDDEVIKTMTSSGTSGQNVSKIYLDKITATNQQKAMVKIVSDFTGSSRMPMIIIDCPSVVKDRRMFSARGAGILGFSIFGSKKMYALNDDMQLNLKELKEFLEKYKDKKILLFGFTFMIWQHFYKELVRLKEETGEQLDLSNAILIHGGGWKKLVSEAVSADEFKQRMTDICGLSDIHDYYGMVEQTGCIYMECECGHLHASIFSDVIIRNPKDFAVCPHGEPGMIQVVSTIPESYPGHSLLTEDEGVVLGEDDCPCGRKGKYFKVLGRIKDAEIRGCSDTYAVDRSRKHAISTESANQAFAEVSYLVGDADIVWNMLNVAPLSPFSDEIVDFCDDLSKELMRDKTAKSYADVVTLGFWLRRASVNGLKKQYMSDDDNTVRIGRGVAFHIAPSNVPVNFAYSLFTGLLTGNANVVRVPSKDFPQVHIISQAIDKILDKHDAIRSYIALVRYDRDATVNSLLSNLCDIRIVWGGDATISELRESKLPPRATEITFADRYSLAVINADIYMSLEDKKRIAMDFYNDTYLTDQNACTSPRVVVWTGEHKAEAKKVFWDNLHEIVEARYSLQPIQAMDKLVTSCLAATADASEQIGNVKVVTHQDNLLIRVSVEKLTAGLMKYRGNSGYFYEYDCTDIAELKEFCNNVHCQTLGYIGDVEDLKPLLAAGVKGIDRIVPMGHTMDFDLIWDGYDLVRSMTRTIAIK